MSGASGGKGSIPYIDVPSTLTTEEIRRVRDALGVAGLVHPQGNLPLPTRAGTIYGWRWWWVEAVLEQAPRQSLRAAFRLHSIHQDTDLPPRLPMRAICMRGHFQREWDLHGQAPSALCGCGIYAFKRLEDAWKYWSKPSDPVRVLAGRLAMWGHVIEHELGYRAEYAYPVQLLCLEKHVEWAGKVGETYGVPVTVFPDELASLIP